MKEKMKECKSLIRRIRKARDRQQAMDLAERYIELCLMIEDYLNQISDPDCRSITRYSYMAGMPATHICDMMGLSRRKLYTILDQMIL